MSEFSKIIGNLENIIRDSKEGFCYIHGDLVPPNILISGKKVCLIDLEYFRPDLPLFDYVYLQYFAKHHKIPVNIKLPKGNLTKIYCDLISCLNTLWWIDFKHKQLRTG